MKKIIILTCFSCFIFGVICPAASGEPARGVNIGISIGAFPIISGFYSYRFGGEVGYQFTERIGIIAEFAYGYTTSLYKEYGYRFYFECKKTYSSAPISVSLFFITPIGKGFSTYIGLGLGYYSIRIKDGCRIPEREPDKIKGYAPHINVGINSSISNRITIFGEVKQSVGKLNLKKIGYIGLREYSIEEDVHFGGPEVKIGIRFYFKD